MSVLTYIASDAPLKEIENPHYKTLSVNEALAIGMDVPESMLASDFDKDQPGILLWSDVEIHIDTVHKTIDDGGHDDNFAIRPLEKTADIFSEKQYCVYLEWQFTEGRANRIIEYLKEHLAHTDSVEIWHIWMGHHDEYDYPPRIRNSEISKDKLSADVLKEITALAVWQEPITHYCFTIS